MHIRNTPCKDKRILKKMHKAIVKRFQNRMMATGRTDSHVRWASLQNPNYSAKLPYIQGKIQGLKAPSQPPLKYNKRLIFFKMIFFILFLNEQLFLFSSKNIFLKTLNPSCVNNFLPLPQKMKASDPPVSSLKRKFVFSPKITQSWVGP